jgi:AcrR family transcriptional regulator
VTLPEPAKRTRRRVSKAKQKQFLELVANAYSVTYAAAAVGVNRRTMYRLKDKDDEFAAAWDDAWEAGADVVSDEIRRRAIEGVEEPLVSGGKIVGSVRRFSDRLLELEAKRRRPGEYRESVKVEGGEPITFVLDSVLERARREIEIEGEILAIDAADADAGDAVDVDTDEEPTP